MPTLIDLLERKRALSSGSLPLFQKRSLERFYECGWPTKKMEAFHYFPLQRVLSCEAEEAPAVMHLANVPKKAVCLPLETAFSKYGPYLQSAFHTLIEEEVNPFALFQLAFCQEHYFLYIPAGFQSEGPIEVGFDPTQGCAFSKLHILVGKGAEARVRVQPSEVMKGGFHHFFLSAQLEDNARLNILSERGAPQQGPYFESLRVRQKKDARFHHFIESAGGVATRHDIDVQLVEPGAWAQIAGRSKLIETNECHMHIHMAHKAPHCSSNQHIKTALFDASRSSFQGKVYVESQAQKTQAYQLNNNLLLGERAKAYAKPNLEIFADDVIASHGATIGQLSDEELTYLALRGITWEQGKEMLTRAFLKEMDSLYAH